MCGISGARQIEKLLIMNTNMGISAREVIVADTYVRKRHCVTLVCGFGLSSSTHQKMYKIIFTV